MVAIGTENFSAVEAIFENPMTSSRGRPLKATAVVCQLLLLLLLVFDGHHGGPSMAAASPVGAAASAAEGESELVPCTRKMELQSPILYKLCLYYTHETGIEELEHEDGRWIEDAKNLLLRQNNGGGGADGSLKREDQPRVHHMFIRFGRRR